MGRNKGLVRKFVRAAFEALEGRRLMSGAPPVANDDAYAATEDVVLTVDAATGVLADDTDPEADALTAVLITPPAHGTLSLAADGSFVYTPTANFNGTDTFVYKANDGTGDSATNATVTITIAAANDAPDSVDDAYGSTEDAVLTVAVADGVLDNDTDPDAGATLTAILVAGPAHGTLTLNPNGSFSYTPAQNFAGTDTFSYKSRDGALDGDTAVVTITVSAANDVPDSVNDAFTTAEDTPLVVAAAGVLGNDTDRK